MPCTITTYYLHILSHKDHSFNVFPHTSIPFTENLGFKIPGRCSALRARACQPTANLHSTYLQTEVKDHPASLEVMFG